MEFWWCLKRQALKYARLGSHRERQTLDGPQGVQERGGLEGDGGLSRVGDWSKVEVGPKWGRSRVRGLKGARSRERGG